MKKNFTPFVFAVSIVLSLFIILETSTTYGNTSTINVTVNGQTVNFSGQRPTLVDGRVLVPVREVFETLGFTVQWVSEVQQVSLTRATDRVTIVLGEALFETSIAGNISWHLLDVPAQVISGSTMLPIRAVVESVGYSLTWNSETSTVSIFSSSGPATQQPSAPTPPVVPQQPAISGLGTSLTLSEAERNPGLFIKDGDRFIRIPDQWGNVTGGANQHRQNSWNNVFTAFRRNSNMQAVIFPSNFTVPRIPSDAQLVLIGVTNINIYEPFHSGWTIAYGVSLGADSQGITIQYHDASNRWVSYETINGQAPANFSNRMVHTRLSWPHQKNHGILTGTQGESFTFGGIEWVGTTANVLETTHRAEHRFFTMRSHDTASNRMVEANYEIVRTMNGYFEINFITPPSGYLLLGSPSPDRVVYFTNSTFAPPN